MIYHLGGKPLTGRRAVALRFSARTEQQSISRALLGGRHAGPAALVGGALGAVAGGLIGHSMDEEAQARLRQQAPQTYARLDQRQPLNLADVKALAEAKVSDEVIL